MEWNAAESRYEYVCKGIAAAKMFSPIYACQMYTDTDGNVYYGGALAFCTERYIAQKMGDTGTLGGLVKRIAIYGDAARTYFGG